jgi:hypothetical protein
MWIHVPSTYSQFAVDTVASSWGYMQPWLDELGQSAMWKTNSVSLQSWRRVWQTVPSIRLLSGLTSAPSIQARGVAKWLSSVAGSPASPSPSLDSNGESMMNGTSGPPSQDSLGGLGFQLSFLKMSPESSDTTGRPYDPNYERWVTRLRRDSSQRQKLAHLTRENASSSWPTPMASDENNRQQTENWKGTNDLPSVTANWPTPASRDWKGFDPPGKQNTHKDPKMYHSIPQAPVITPDGHTCSPSCRRLNPLFAEMLMGLPQGWTDASEPLATALFQQWQHSLSLNLANRWSDK